MMAPNNQVRVFGIYREKMFSPGKVQQDRAVLDGTLAELARVGYLVTGVASEGLDGKRPEAALVLSMAQSPRNLAILASWRAAGIRVVNSASSVRDCYRVTLFRRLDRAGLPLPQTEVLPTEAVAAHFSIAPPTAFWLKRPDVHAIRAGDVAKVVCAEELDAAVLHFRRHRIDQVVVQEDVPGDVIKFYGVGPGRFFAAYKGDGGQRCAIEDEELRRTAECAAEAIGLEVYGGDAVITPESGVRLIDINDWPSFSPCGEEATKAIARHSADLLKGART